MSTPDPAALDLTQFLAIDLSAMAEDYRRRQDQGVRDRFLAGLLQLLRDHDQPSVFWLEIPYGVTTGSTHWVRMEADPKEHDRRLSGKTSPETKSERALFKSLGAVRSAISSASRDTCCQLPQVLPAWQQRTRLERADLVAILSHLLANPAAVLTDALQADILANRLGHALPAASSPGPAPRM